MSKNAIYWVTSALLALELVLSGVWDILRVPQVHIIIDRGYPSYFLVILGVWGNRWTITATETRGL